MKSAPIRIPPLALDNLTEEQAELGGGRDNARCQLNIVRTLVRHPTLYRNWIPLAEQLGMHSLLPARDKEILILRSASLCQERYEIAHHLYIARAAGMNDAEIEIAKNGGSGLTQFEQALISAAEELVNNHSISDTSWGVLSAQYSSMQMIEVVFTVANYTLMAMVTNSLGIQPEEDVKNAWKPT